MNGKKRTWGHAIGGMGAITQAMARSARAHGVEIETDAPVREVLIEKDHARGVVLADGRIVTASPHEHADLFWGIRGGGGNFGIVTEFEFALHPLGPIVMAGLMLWPFDRADEVMRAWRDYMDHAPDELSTGFCAITAPPEEFVPPAWKGQSQIVRSVPTVDR